MRDYMDCTTSFCLNEVRLGHERFGKETHAYSVAYADYEIDEVIGHADNILFNSIAQLDRFADKASAIVRGLRLNPPVRSSSFHIADPARPFRRLGDWEVAQVEAGSQERRGGKGRVRRGKN